MVAAAVVYTAQAATPDQSIYADWVQPGPPPVERFVRPLGLSADQQKKLQPIFDDARAKAVADARPRSEPSESDAVGGVPAQREADFRLRLAAVLNPQQMAQYDALAAARASDARTSDPHPAHGHREGTKEAPALESPVEPK